MSLPLPTSVLDEHSKSINLPPLEAANEARERAALARARMLVKLGEGTATVLELLDRARHPDGGVYQRITLTQLLRACGYSHAATVRVLNHTVRVAGSYPTPRRSLTLSWLLDGRSGGRRIAAFQDALAPRERPWTGYPWAPDPNPNRPLGLRTDAEGRLL